MSYELPGLVPGSSPIGAETMFMVLDADGSRGHTNVWKNERLLCKLFDTSRFVLQSEFYDNERAEIVEDTFHKAILKYGSFDTAYLDNGTQYVSEQLMKSCARRGINLCHATPRACESKGKIEKFHQVVDRFLAEVSVAHVHSVDELNRLWKVMLDQDYQRKPHDGIAENYKSLDVPVPEGGISPQTEWLRDERMLRFHDVSVVAEAFLHHEERRNDNTGCFSLGGRKYEASTALCGCTVEVRYDPMNTETVTVIFPGMEGITARRVTIRAFSDRKPELPAGMTARPERRVIPMYESFFCMEHMPFRRNIPADRLYYSKKLEDAVERLRYAADNELFTVVMSEPGCGKSTLIRMVEHSLPKERYTLLYLSDSKLTPWWLYAGLLDQLGLESRFYRGDSKRNLQRHRTDQDGAQKGSLRSG